ncbi:MAG TPA: transglycosylase domain-containing protein [Solirubrobacteraceae bacterium]|nr:transglycosylase domain-containing protein [Solirubrobacteraceae bacterium]
MSDDDVPPTSRSEPPAPIPFAPPRRRLRPGRRRAERPKIKKLRLLSVIVGLGAIAAASLVFGMMMAVASNLPQLENKRQYGPEANSYLYDDHNRLIGIFSPPDPEVIDSFQGLGRTMRQAIVSVEDRHFWTDPGIDLRSTVRALLADLTGHSTQGASTIAQQFIKNALAEEDNRTIFEKLREATLAFHLVHEWRRQKILTEYLNSIYFGNGAYGVESAARVYFGRQLGYDAADPAHGRCGNDPHKPRLPTCASRLNPAQAALLAGMVANPSAFDPTANPHDAWLRRDLVLQDMRNQGDISEAAYERWRTYPLPKATDIQTPTQPSAAPYFTSWLAPQILSAMGLGHGVPAKLAEFHAYYGGLRIHTTIDLRMQQAAENAIAQMLPSGKDEPTASLVAIDNRTGQVRAMVGGPLVDGPNGWHEDYAKYPFNLATQAERQPGSAFKPFTLAVALEHGYGPDSVFDSRPIDIRDPKVCGQANYAPRNYNNEYVGLTTLAGATAQSDNSVFTQLGMSRAVGTKRIAKMARAAGIQTPVSTNCSMIIGGLKVGVSPLEMAHAYETFAEGGRRVYDPVLGSPGEGPIGIGEIYCPLVKCRGKRKLVATPHYRRVMPAAVAAAVHSLLEGVVHGGTGTAADIPGVDVVGKTGTTNNEGDAWFVGWTPQITTAVWVGFPNRLVPMLTQFNGGPVTGGTFPAEIFKAFTEQAIQIIAEERAARAGHHAATTTTVPTVQSTTPVVTGTTPAATATTPGATATTPAPTTPATTPSPGTVTNAPAGTATTPATGGGGGATTPGSTTPGGGSGGSGGTGGAGLPGG